MYKQMLGLFLLLTFCANRPELKAEDLNNIEKSFCFDSIQNVFHKYERGVTAFQLGVPDQNFPFQMMQNFPFVTWIMIEDTSALYGTNSSELLERCIREKCQKHVLLGKTITPDDLTILGQCEHFDVVCAFDLVERFGDQWDKAAEALLTLGDHTFVKITYNEHVHDYQALELLLIAHGAQQVSHALATTTTHEVKLYLLENKKEILPIPCWRWHKRLKRFSGKFKIISTYTEKMIYKARDKTWYPWTRGINAYTFKILHGMYPTNEMISNRVRGFVHIRHNDCKLWNMIIQGNNVCLIDFDDKRFSCSKKIHKMRIDAALAIFNDDPVWFSSSSGIMQEIKVLYRKCKKIYNLHKFFDF